jgi:hypothetical protein
MDRLVGIQNLRPHAGLVGEFHFRFGAQFPHGVGQPFHRGWSLRQHFVRFPVLPLVAQRDDANTRD